MIHQDSRAAAGPAAPPRPAPGPDGQEGAADAEGGSPLARLAPTDTFVRRHVGPDEAEIAQMLGQLGLASLDELIDETVPAGIRLDRPLELETCPPAASSASTSCSTGCAASPRRTRSSARSSAWATPTASPRR